VVYSLQELDGDDNMFSITTVNGKGIIRLIGQLDYEHKFLYQLRVMAVDRSNNERVSYTALLEIFCESSFSISIYGMTHSVAHTI
jgi:hypothetical protein